MPLTENQIMLTAIGACSSKVSVITGPKFFLFMLISLCGNEVIFLRYPWHEKGGLFRFILYLVLETVKLFVDFVMSLS